VVIDSKKEKAVRSMPIRSSQPEENSPTIKGKADMVSHEQKTRAPEQHAWVANEILRKL
jgi:hypothetical protein